MLLFLTKLLNNQDGRFKMATVLGLTTTNVRRRNEAKEMMSSTSISTNMEFNEMQGYMKKMTAMAAHCHTFNCANAASCYTNCVHFLNFSNTKTSPKCRIQIPGRGVFRYQCNGITLLFLKSKPSNALSCVFKTPSPTPQIAPINRGFSVPINPLDNLQLLQDN